MTISLAGAPVASGGTWSSDISVNVTAVNNLLVVFGLSTAACTVTDLTCPKVPGGFVKVGAWDFSNHHYIFIGTATAAGPTVIKCVVDGTPMIAPTGVCQQLSTTNPHPMWQLDGEAAFQYNPVSKSQPLPRLTPSAPGLAYLGMFFDTYAPKSVTSGFTKVTVPGMIVGTTEVYRTGCPTTEQAPALTMSTDTNGAALALVLRDA